MKTTTYTASKGKKKLVNITFADAREYASIGGWKVTGFDKMKTKPGFGKEKNLMKINPSGKGWHGGGIETIRHQNAGKYGFAGPLYKKNPNYKVVYTAFPGTKYANSGNETFIEAKSPSAVINKFKKTFKGARITEVKQNPMAEKRAKEILGDRASWELKNMKRALESFPILNTPEEKERLEAVKTMLRSRQRLSADKMRKVSPTKIRKSNPHMEQTVWKKTYPTEFRVLDGKPIRGKESIVITKVLYDPIDKKKNKFVVHKFEEDSMRWYKEFGTLKEAKDFAIVKSNPLTTEYDKASYRAYKLEDTDLFHLLRDFMKNKTLEKGIKVRLKLKSLTNKNVPRVSTTDDRLIKMGISEIAREKAMREKRIVTIGEVENQLRSNPGKAKTLDFPKQKSNYNTHITVYVPSTKSKNKKISASHYNKRIKEVQNFLTKKWGGTTQVSGVGTYTDSKGNLIGESVAKVEVFTQPKDYNKFDQDVKKFIERKRKSWGQETMLFTYESKNRPAEGAYLVPYAK